MWRDVSFILLFFFVILPSSHSWLVNKCPVWETGCVVARVCCMRFCVEAVIVETLLCDQKKSFLHALHSV